MPEWRVQYEVDVEADTAEQAAQIAYEQMIDPSSLPPVLDVWAVDGEKSDGEPWHQNIVRIDLLGADYE